MSLILRALTEGDEAAFLAGLADWEGESPHWYSFIWGPGVTYAAMLDRLAKNAAGVDMPPGRVPSTMLYGFVEGRIVGRVSVRLA